VDTNKFSQNCPGRIVPVSTQWGGDHAFIPAPLPPSWRFPEHLWPLLSEAKQQIGILEGLGRTLPNPAILLRPMADREAIRSSRLEGTYASPRELLLFELEPRESKSERDPVNDHREVFNYRRALLHGTESELPLSLRLLRELHEILLKGVRGKEKSPGQFRRIQVGIGSEGRFIPPPADAMANCLDDLEKYFHREQPEIDGLVDCFLCHYQFETIHPFIDGNGRVGRLLLAIMMQQRLGMSKPWLYMSEYFERFKDDYVSHLFNVSAKGEWTTWVGYCLRGTLQQAKETITRCEKLRSLRERFMNQITESGGSVRLLQIVEGIFHSPFIRVADLPARLGVTYPTAKADIDRLVDSNILRELPDTYPKTYFAPEVFAVSYDEIED
jgi:Fic family protein